MGPLDDPSLIKWDESQMAISETAVIVTHFRTLWNASQEKETFVNFFILIFNFVCFFFRRILVPDSVVLSKLPMLTSWTISWNPYCTHCVSVVIPRRWFPDGLLKFIHKLGDHTTSRPCNLHSRTSSKIEFNWMITWHCSVDYVVFKYYLFDRVMQTLTQVYVFRSNV